MCFEGKYFMLSDLYVGKIVTIAAQPLPGSWYDVHWRVDGVRKLYMTFCLRQIIRADERCLQFLEALGRDGVKNKFHTCK